MAFRTKPVARQNSTSWVALLAAAALVPVLAWPPALSAATLEPTLAPTETATPTLTPTATPTPTPTSARPTPVARATVYPNPAHGGDIVTLDGSASSPPIASAQWFDEHGTALAPGLVGTFVAPDVTVETTLHFQLFLQNYGGSAGASISVSVTVLPPMCTGDCDGDDAVTVAELLTLVNIALGTTDVGPCDAGDGNHDGEITVVDLLAAVTNALDGCPRNLDGTITYYGSSIPVSGAEVELAGPTTRMTQTDANGQFVFVDVPPGAWRLQPRKTADFQYGVDVNDINYVLEAATGRRTLGREQRLACDVTGSGVVAAQDATVIQEFVQHSLTSFPAADRCASDWIFVPTPEALLHQSVTLPVVSPDSCQPGSVRYDPLAADATDQDFQALLIGDCDLSWPNRVPQTPMVRSPSRRFSRQ